MRKMRKKGQGRPDDPRGLRDVMRGLEGAGADGGEERGRGEGAVLARALAELARAGEGEGWRSAGEARVPWRERLRELLGEAGVGLEPEREAAGLREALVARWGSLEGEDQRAAARLWWYALLRLRAGAYADKTPLPERVREEALGLALGSGTLRDASGPEVLGDPGRGPFCHGWVKLGERLEEAYLELSLIKLDPAFKTFRHPLDEPALGWAGRGLLAYLERREVPVAARELVAAGAEDGGTLRLLRRLYAEGWLRARAQGMAAPGLEV